MTNSNEPAFPLTGPDISDKELGLTKREYFAAMILQGMLAGSPKGQDGSPEHIFHTTNRAVSAVEHLIEQLNKEGI